MEDMYSLSEKALMSPDNFILSSDYQSLFPAFGSDELIPMTPEIQREEEVSTEIKAKIASHPRYPTLLQAYIDCKKVGAPPEIASLLDECRQEQDVYGNETVSTCLAADPELDEFMETYCDILLKHKSDLARPFDEATTFLNDIELQLRNLSTGASITSVSDEGAVSSEEDLNGETEVREVHSRGDELGLKDRLFAKYGGHLSTLKQEFSKKKKKGKLPKEARQILLQWWNLHYKWPYPTETDKTSLAASTGLDQKQINNWFINQRKRHWKPSESMQIALMQNFSGRFLTDD